MQKAAMSTVFYYGLFSTVPGFYYGRMFIFDTASFSV